MSAPSGGSAVIGPRGITRKALSLLRRDAISVLASELVMCFVGVWLLLMRYARADSLKLY